jgi:RNA polymerase sigma-70 factor (ECF subfamily)
VAQQDFAVFFAENWTDVAGYGRSLTNDRDVGDELAQEAMARVYARYPMMREPRRYAFRIVSNLARDRWKSIARERAAWDSVSHTARPERPDGGILDAVQRLRPGHREVLLLHYWADMTVEQISQVLHRPAGTVKRRLHEARAQLSEAMGGTL